MKLSESDAKLFYKLWLPLLDYVNETKKVNRQLKSMASAESLDPRQVKEVADVLWSEVELIDSYLSKNKEIRGREREILISWKRCVRGQFILERFLKKGAILISGSSEDVYLVSGIISSWDEMLGYAGLPLMIEATLIPFEDVIIHDSLLQMYNVIIGRNAAGNFKDIYMDAKKAGTIHKQL